MREYDATLKMLLRESAATTFRELAGVSVAKWLDIELPKVQTLQLDLLGQTADESLIHLELQSGNDPKMPLRMAEYALGVYRQFGRFPRQIVLYVGEAPLRMAPQWRVRRFRFDIEWSISAIWTASDSWQARGWAIM